MRKIGFVLSLVVLINLAAPSLGVKAMESLMNPTENSTENERKVDEEVKVNNEQKTNDNKQEILEDTQEDNNQQEDNIEVVSEEQQLQNTTDNPAILDNSINTDYEPNSNINEVDLKPGKTRKIQAYQIDDSILIVWSQVSNCDEYELEVDGEIINCKDTDSYHHYNLVAGTNHSYRVRAKNSYGVGEWSDIVYKTYELEQLSIPEDVKSISKSNEIDISCKEVFNAKEYQLEINV